MKRSFSALSLITISLLCGAPLTAHAVTTLVANDFGAKGDGVKVDTAAVQRALDAAAGKHATVTLRNRYASSWDISHWVDLCEERNES